MANRVSFSKKNQELSDISTYYIITKEALKEYYFPDNGKHGYHMRFFGESLDSVKEMLATQLEELDMTSSFSLLSALEASFRIDFMRRCYEKRKDELSRVFRDIYSVKSERASLEDDILQTWRDHCVDRESQQTITALIGAMKYRNWIAHGRYWVPKNWGRSKFDYDIIYEIAYNIYTKLDLLNYT